MIIKFKAKVIAIETFEEDNYYLIGFADDEFDTKNYIQFQKSIEPDIDDEKLGIDGYYFEYNSQINSGYNKCKSVEINKHYLKIELKDSKDVIIVEIAPSTNEYISLKNMLKIILKNILIEKSNT